MKKYHLYILYVIAVLAIITMFFINPITQNQEYHNFADDKCLLNVSNFWNVFSNVPFVIIGIYGLFLVNKLMKNEVLKPNCYWFFIGIFLTGFGSAYYHYNPNDTTLIWDRLPMTISFMSFFTIIIGTFINTTASKRALFPLIGIGLMSILFWVIFSDLRLYFMVQFLPIILLFVILLLSNKNNEFKKYFWYIVSFYIIAKILETNDLQIYNFTNQTISGHTLKHFSAAVASFIFCFFIAIRFCNSNDLD
jgi:hypothetical protein